MHICFDHQIFSKKRHGGVSRYFCELANSLRTKYQDHIEIFAPLHKNSYLQKSPLSKGRYISDFQSSSLLIRAIDTALGLAILPRKKGVDIFHETYYSAFDLKPRGAARIVTVHDMIHEKFPKFFSSIDITASAKKNAVMRSDHVICISRSTQRDLIDILGVDPLKTSVIYHGQSFRCTNSVTVRPVQSPYVLYVGERRGYKNFDSLLTAYSTSRIRHEGFKLVCFGGGKFSSEERETIRFLGLLENDLIQTSGGDELLAAYYSHASMFIYPSLYEGFGIPLLEAMQMNCPIACSATSSMPEVCINSALYFDPTDIDDIRHQIETLAFDPITATNIARQGAKRVTEFSWERCATETKNTYENVRGQK